jgi:hypothetical protein
MLILLFFHAESVKVKEGNGFGGISGCKGGWGGETLLIRKALLRVLLNINLLSILRNINISQLKNFS